MLAEIPFVPLKRLFRLFTESKEWYVDLGLWTKMLRVMLFVMKFMLILVVIQLYRVKYKYKVQII